MKWRGRSSSQNVEDRRGVSPTGLIAGGIGTIILILIVALLGGDPSQIINDSQEPSTENSSGYVETAEEKELSDFVKVVFADTETVWTEIFREEGLTYSYPTLVLYSGAVESTCGVSSSSTGPFYCPGDHKVYVDLSFCNELQVKLNAPGDFAIAYVIAHEVGHHVQTLLGTTDKVMELQTKLSEKEFNEYLVRFELQADYLAGVWANHAEQMGILEAGDIEEALNAASAVGDDRIQQNTYGYTVPDSFTHGTSEQRNSWFYKGYTSGTLSGGDTFNASEL